MKKLIFLLCSLIAGTVFTACGGMSSGEERFTGLPETQETMTGGQLPVTEPDADRNLTPGNNLTARLGWESGQLQELEEICAFLDENGIRYSGYFNRSEERLDVKTEDGLKLMFLLVSNEDGEGRRYELIMVDERFNKNGFQENFLHEYDVTTGEEFYPDTINRPLDQAEVLSMNQTQLSIARNQIYARHGRIMKDPFLRAAFEMKSWYEPRYQPDEFEQRAEPFTDIEQENLKRIRDTEAQKYGNTKINGVEIAPSGAVLSGSWLDLDGDGNAEQIRYRTERNAENSFGEYEITAGEATVSGSGENLYEKLSVISPDGEKQWLLAGGDGPGADPFQDLYIYKKGQLIFAGTLPGEYLGYGNGQLYVKVKKDFFQSSYYTFAYELDVSDCVTQIGQDFWPLFNEAAARTDIRLYADSAGTKDGILLEEGDEVVIVQTDLSKAVEIQKLSTQETGWLLCEPPYTCVLTDGSRAQASELFDGLPYFG